MYSTRQKDIDALKKLIDASKKTLKLKEENITSSGFSSGKRISSPALLLLCLLAGAILLIKSKALSVQLTQKAGYFDENFLGYNTVNAVFYITIILIVVVLFVTSIMLIRHVSCATNVGKSIDSIIKTKEALEQVGGIVETYANEIQAKANRGELPTVFSTRQDLAGCSNLFAKVDKTQDDTEKAIKQWNSISAQKNMMKGFWGFFAFPIVILVVICSLVILPWFSKTIDHYSSAKYGKVNDVLLFGTYDQDHDVSNGQERIQWRILDRKDNRLLLVSDSVLATRSYHSSYSNITWEDSSIRRWLNNDFYRSAFSVKEQELIVNGPIENIDYIKEEMIEKNGEWRLYRYDTYKQVPRNPTYDSVFLLSFEEAKKLSSLKPNMSSRYWRYALDEDSQYSMWLGWILRSLIRYDNGGRGYIAMGSSEEEVSQEGYRRAFAVIEGNPFGGWYLNYNDTYRAVSDENTGIRPAIWLYAR